MLQEIGKATFLIFLAEMGDKTQILAMAFALQYSVRQVLSGVAIGSLFNHGLAVIIGAYLAHLIPFGTIKFGSAILFLGFGLWTLLGQEDELEKSNESSGHPILVVALAFFLGELGDKTQLTAIALATDASSPLNILMGTVLGMVLTSLVGIIVGLKLGERIPEFILKVISGTVFIAFGLINLTQTIPSSALTESQLMFLVIILAAIITIIVIPPLTRQRRATTEVGQLRKVARALHRLEQVLNDLCLGDTRCRQKKCPLGYCKSLIRQELNGFSSVKRERSVIKPYIKMDQHFDQAKVGEVLEYLEEIELNPIVYNELKANLEKLLESA